MAPICPLPDTQKGIVEMLHILSENISPQDPSTISKVKMQPLFMYDLSFLYVARVAQMAKKCQT